MKTICYSLLFLLAITTSAQSYTLNLQLSGNSNTDNLQVQFIAGATPGFDTTFDSRKAFNMNNAALSVFTTISGPTYLALNALPLGDLDTAIEVRMQVGVAGNYVFSATETALFSAGQCIMLEDVVNHVYYDLRNGNSIPVTLAQTASTDPAQFVIHFKSSPVVNTDSLTCNGAGNGAIRIMGAGWGYALTGSGNISIQNNPMMSTNADTVNGLGAGTYYSLFTTSMGCAFHDTIQIGQPVAILPGFTSVDTVFLCDGGTFTANNTSSGASRYLWDFGDGGNSMSSQSNQFMVNGTHNYTGDTAGTYQVTLFAMSGHCLNSFSKTIQVSTSRAMAHTSGVNNDRGVAGIPVISFRGAQLFVTQSQGVAFPVQTTIYNALGQQLVSFSGNGAAEYEFSLENIATNTLIVKAESNGQVTTKKTVLIGR
jgi:hypothetical protein